MSTHRLALVNLLCRICGHENKNCLSVFGESGRKQGIQKKIRACLPLVVEETDVMPKQICLSCLNKLDATWELFQLCKEGQNIIAQKLHLVSGLNNYDRPKFMLSSIEERIKSLSENKSIKFGESAIISLAPSSPPPQKKIKEDVSPVTPVIAPIVPSSSDSLMGINPAQGIIVNSAPVAYIQPTVSNPMEQTQAVPISSPIKEGVYPETLIKVNPDNTPVMYQHRSQTNQVSNPATRRSVPAPKPMPMPMAIQNTPINSKRRTSEGNSGSVPLPKRSHLMCTYCNKTFPDDIIDHHVNLHLRKSFFTCLDCNKNFRSEEAMTRHRCGVSGSINLDPDDDLILV